MKSVLEAVNLYPSDEKILSDSPQFNRVMEAMEMKDNSRQANETTIFCTFTDKTLLEAAVNRLAEKGFLHSEISTYTSHDGNLLDHRGSLKESKLGEGLLLGTTIGVVLGALFGLFSPLTFYTPFREAPLLGFFNGVLFAVIWGFVGGVLGALVGRSIPEYDEHKYDTRLDHGTILVIVKVEGKDRIALARVILAAYGGDLVSPESLRVA